MAQKEKIILVDGSGSVVAGPKGYFEDTLKELVGAVEENNSKGQSTSLYLFGETQGARLIANKDSTPEEIIKNVSDFRNGHLQGTELAPSLKSVIEDVSKLDGKERRGIGVVLVTDGDLFDGKGTAAELKKITENPKSTVDAVLIGDRAKDWQSTQIGSALPEGTKLLGVGKDATQIAEAVKEHLGASTKSASKWSDQVTAERESARQQQGNFR